MSLGCGEVIGYYVGEDMTGPYCPDCYENMGVAGGDPRSDADTPIFAIGHEADTPSHCELCEALIPHDLTPDGIEYVREAVQACIDGAPDAGRPAIVEQWRRQYLPNR